MEGFHVVLLVQVITDIKDSTPFETQQPTLPHVGVETDIPLEYEEVNCKTASDHFTCFSFSFLYKINKQTWLIWLVFTIAEKSIKIFFYEIKLGNKVEPHYHIAPMLTLLHI